MSNPLNLSVGDTVRIDLDKNVSYPVVFAESSSATIAIIDEHDDYHPYAVDAHGLSPFWIPADHIKEVISRAKPAPQDSHGFKVGDKVRLNVSKIQWTDALWVRRCEGKVMTVRSVDRTIHVVENPFGFDSSWLELVTDEHKAEQNANPLRRVTDSPKVEVILLKSHNLLTNLKLD